MPGEAENGDHLEDVLLKHLATTHLIYTMPKPLPPSDYVMYSVNKYIY
jgi:hypothetical protein